MPTVPPARIAALLPRLSRPNIERDVRHLSTAYLSRHTLGRYAGPASEWIAGRLRENGVKDVSFHRFRAAGRELRNVLGNGPGVGPRTILACAHYDSRAVNLADPNASAPGANDNGTGVAVLLELARVLSGLRLTDHLRFAFFTGEEEGLWGSFAYARQVKAERLDLRFVFNLDQIGFPPPDRALFVDCDEGGDRANNAASAALVARIQGLARNVVKVPTRVDPAADSDYMPFEALGYVITGLYEAGKDYPAYHRSDDTIDKVDFDYVYDMARLSLATLLSEGGLR